MASLASTIFKKELRETLRDKRVVLGVIVSPLLVTPLLIGAIFFFAGKKSIELQTATLDIGLVEEAAFPELTDFLDSQDNLNLTRFETRAEAKDSLQALQIRAALVIPAPAREAFVSDDSAPIELLFNNANENSSNAHNRLKSLFASFNQNALQRRLEERGLEKSFIQPTQLTETNIAETEAMVGFALSMILPYLVVMGAAFGGITTAFDLCAGEKERGTMETLLVSPASRRDIVQGKLFAIFVISLISAICSILGILIVMVFGGQVAKSLIDQELAFSYANLAALVLIVIPLSLLTSAALLLLSSFARNQKEAQAYLFPLIAIALFPAVLSSILGAESPLYTAFIPILNIALAMKQLLGNVFDLNFFCIALGSSLVYAILAMQTATKLFQRETILFRN